MGKGDGPGQEGVVRGERQGSVFAAASTLADAAAVVCLRMRAGGGNVGKTGCTR